MIVHQPISNFNLPKWRNQPFPPFIGCFLHPWRNPAHPLAVSPQIRASAVPVGDAAVPEGTASIRLAARRGVSRWLKGICQIGGYKVANVVYKPHSTLTIIYSFMIYNYIYICIFIYICIYICIYIYIYYLLYL